MRVERFYFRPEKADRRSRRADLRPERADFRPEKANWRSRRADLYWAGAKIFGFIIINWRDDDWLDGHLDRWEGQTDIQTDRQMDKRLKPLKELFAGS